MPDHRDRLLYDEARIGELDVVKPPAVAGDGAGWPLVDDLPDAGATARVVHALLPRAHFATVRAKPQGRPLVDSLIAEVSQDSWILFPWDTEARFIAPIARTAAGG